MYKHERVYKEYVVIFLLLLISVPVFSQKFNLDFISKLGMSSSGICELVFEDGFKASELDWRSYSPIISLNSVISICNFIFNFSFFTSIPVALGFMIDKDFFQNVNGQISKYSEHGVIVNKNYSFSLDFFYGILLKRYELQLGFVGTYSNIKLESDDGFLQYPKNKTPWTGAEEKEYLNGCVISYEQSRLLGGVSFNLVSRHFERFGFGGGISFFPFVYIKAIDNHFLRAIQFCDLMPTGMGGAIKLFTSFMVLKNLNISTDFMFQYAEAFGTTRVNSIGIITQDTTLFPDNVRVNTRYFDLSLTLGFCYKILEKK